MSRQRPPDYESSRLIAERGLFHLWRTAYRRAGRHAHRGGSARRERPTFAGDRIGLDRVVGACDDDSIGLIKTIENNRGVLYATAILRLALRRVRTVPFPTNLLTPHLHVSWRSCDDIIRLSKNTRLDGAGWHRCRSEFAPVATAALMPTTPTPLGPARAEYHIAHRRQLAEADTELIWGWGTPAGRNTT